MKLVEIIKLVVKTRGLEKKYDYLEQRLDNIEEVNDNHGK